MPPNEPSHPMMKMIADIASIETTLSDVKPKVDEMHRSMVTKEDCRDRRDEMCKKLDAKLEGKEDTVSATKPTLLERLGKYAGALTAILVLLVTLGGGLLWVGRQLAAVEATMATDRQALSQAQKSMMRELRRPVPPVVVPQPVLIYPDAGVRRRRPRRRPRRIR